tara:strand:- start:509 stop:682 length:174 start_codon:yes stop_codon:yes gene_type:complete
MIKTCSNTFTRGLVKSFANPHREKQQVVNINGSRYCLGMIEFFGLVDINIIVEKRVL